MESTKSGAVLAPDHRIRETDERIRTQAIATLISPSPLRDAGPEMLKEWPAEIITATVEADPSIHCATRENAGRDMI